MNNSVILGVSFVVSWPWRLNSFSELKGPRDEGIDQYLITDV